MGYKEEVMSDQLLIKLLRESRCDECPLDCLDECLLPAMAADRLEALLTELKDEQHRHDRYVDFELDEAEELQKTKEKLEQAVQDITLLAVVGLEGCDICAYNVGDKADCELCDFTCNNCLMDCRCKTCKHGLEFKWRGTNNV